MYSEKEEKKESFLFRADWIAIAIKLLILVAIVFLLIFVITKFKNGKELQIFNKNIEAMRASAYTYFKDEDNRPLSINEQVDISLGDMVSSSMISELKVSKKKTCDGNASYVSLVKSDDTKYDLNVHLVCDKYSKDVNYTLSYPSKVVDSEPTSITLDSDSSSSSVSDSSNSVNDSSSSSSDSSLDTTMYQLRRVVQAPASYSCPSGYTLVGNKCYSDVQLLKTDAAPKYRLIPASNTVASYHGDDVSYDYAPVSVVSSPVTYSCSSGYTLVGNVCEKVIAPTVKESYSYSCPSGYSLNGSYCVKYSDVVKSSAVYGCSNGTLTDDNRCKIVISSKVRCSKGTYDSSKNSCYVLSSTKPSYGDWVYEGIVISKSKKSSSSTVRYTLLGYNGDGMLRYRKETRSKIAASCGSSYMDKNGNCRIYNSSYLVNYCPSGYKLNKSGTKCYKYVSATVKKKSSSSCPSGYVKSGSQCVKKISATKNVSNSYRCKSGYSLINNNCVKRTNAIMKSSKSVYNCPSGYEKVGSGSNTVCRKKNVSNGYYYCSDKSATLSGNRCVKNARIEFIGYRCPSGYELSGNMCYKYTDSKSIKATKTSGDILNEEVIWSAVRKIDGWTFTGKTKKV